MFFVRAKQRAFHPSDSVHHSCTQLRPNAAFAISHGYSRPGLFFFLVFTRPAGEYCFCGRSYAHLTLLHLPRGLRDASPLPDFSAPCAASSAEKVARSFALTRDKFILRACPAVFAPSPCAIHCISLGRDAIHGVRGLIPLAVAMYRDPTRATFAPTAAISPAHFIPNSNGMLTFFMHTESILETRSTAIIDLRRKKNGKDNWN